MNSKSLRDRISSLLLGRNAPTSITENSSLQEIAVQYPTLFEFLERKYGIKTESGENALSLKEFVERHDLPPAQIVFMEVQMGVRTERVRQLTAKQGMKLIQTHPKMKILDVREEWELKICKLPGSEPLSPQLLDEILTEWPKDRPILMYCHFGIRSLDAATFLADRGFTAVHILKGGIDGWSIDVDPKIPRYQNAWC